VLLSPQAVVSGTDMVSAGNRDQHCVTLKTDYGGNCDNDVDDGFEGGDSEMWYT
jgi:hypothetical protein